MTNIRTVELEYASRDYSVGLKIPVSHGGNTWITIPWDSEIEDPALPNQTWGQHAGPKGWSVLSAGPCIFWGEVAAMIQGGLEEESSFHLMGRFAIVNADGTQSITSTLQASERQCQKHETHHNEDGSVYYSNTHLGPMPLTGRLRAGERLQIVIDHWNGQDCDARLVSANVTLHYVIEGEM